MNPTQRQFTHVWRLHLTHVAARLPMRRESRSRTERNFWMGWGASAGETCKLELDMKLGEVEKVDGDVLAVRNSQTPPLVT